MAIAESAGEVLGRKLGPLPVGGWAAIGIGVIVVVKLLGGKKSSSGVVTVPDAFAGDAGGGSGTTTTTGTTPVATAPVSAPAHYRLTVTGETRLFSALGKLLGEHVSSGTFDATKVKVGGKWYYRIKSGGRWRFIQTTTKTIRVSQVQ